MKTPSPRSFKHDFFGALKWDKEHSWYTGQVALAARVVDVFIEGEGESAEVAVEQARKRFPKIQMRDSVFRQAAGKALLKVYNENWNDGKPISMEKFTERISIAWIWFHADGRAEVHYDDDDMFLGHSIAVYLDEKLDYDWSALSG